MEFLLTLAKPGMPDPEFRKLLGEKIEEFRRYGAPGLLQAYYVHDSTTGQFGALHFFDSESNLRAFERMMVPAVTEAYRLREPPRPTHLSVVGTLYEEGGPRPPRRRRDTE